MIRQFVSTVFAAAVLSFGIGSSASADDFTAAWEAAEAKRKEAAAVGYEWRDTGKMLKKAKEEAEAGNTEAAMKLVAKAHEESMDAVAQEAREASAWQSRVPQ